MVSLSLTRTQSGSSAPLAGRPTASSWEKAAGSAPEGRLVTSGKRPPLFLPGRPGGVCPSHARLGLQGASQAHRIRGAAAPHGQSVSRLPSPPLPLSRREEGRRTDGERGGVARPPPSGPSRDVCALLGRIQEGPPPYYAAAAGSAVQSAFFFPEERRGLPGRGRQQPPPRGSPQRRLPLMSVPGPAFLSLEVINCCREE